MKQNIAKKYCILFIPALSIFFCIAVYFYPLFFEGGTLFPKPEIVYNSDSFGMQNDELEELLSWRTLTHNTFREGDFPFWNVFSGVGVPLAANNQSGAFSLATWLALWITDPIDAFSFSYLLTLFFAAYAVYGFLRLYNCHQIPALMGAMLFVLQGSLWWDFSNYQPRNWTAIALFFLALGIKRNYRFLPLSFLSMALMFLSTNLQVAGYGQIFLGIYTLVALYETKENRWKLFFIISAGTVAALLIASMQIMAVYQLLEESSHFFTAEQLRFSIPDIQEQFELAGSYVGPLGMLIVVVGGLFPSKVARIFLVLTGLVFILSTGITLHPSLNVDNNYYLMPFILVTPLLFGWGCEWLWLKRWYPVIGLLFIVFITKTAVTSYLFDFSSFTLYNASATSEELKKESKRCLPEIEASKMPPRLIRFRTEDFLLEKAYGGLNEILRQEFPSNIPTVAGYADLQIYDSFIPTRYTDWMDKMEPGIYANEDPIDLRVLSLKKTKTLQTRQFEQLGTEWLVSRVPIQNQQWMLRKQISKEGCLGNQTPLYVYKSNNVLSRAFLTNNQGTAEIVEYSNSKVVLRVEAFENSELVLRDLFYPGWKAYQNKKEIPVSVAEDLFRKVPVEKGVHTITFSYEPYWWSIGLLLAMIGLVVILVLDFVCQSLLLSLRRQSSPSSTGETTPT